MSNNFSRKVSIKGFAPSTTSAEGRKNHDPSALMLDANGSAVVAQEYAQQYHTKNSSKAKDIQNQTLSTIPKQQQKQQKLNEPSRRPAKFSPPTAIWDVSITPPSPSSSTASSLSSTQHSTATRDVSISQPLVATLKTESPQATAAPPPSSPSVLVSPTIGLSQIEEKDPTLPPSVSFFVAPILLTSNTILHQSTLTTRADDYVLPSWMESTLPSTTSSTSATSAAEQSSSSPPTTTPTTMTRTKRVTIISYWTHLTSLLLFDIVHVCFSQGLSWKWLMHQFQKLRIRRQHQHQQLPRLLRKGAKIGTGYSLKSIRGIPNFGQTCFLNSVLQAMASLPSLAVYLHYTNVPESTTLLSQRLQASLQSLNDTTAPSQNRTIQYLFKRIGKTNAQFRRRNEQQDAHELLQALMNLLIEEQLKEGDDDDDDDNDDEEKDLSSSAASLSSMLWRLHKEQKEEQEQEQENVGLKKESSTVFPTKKAESGAPEEKKSDSLPQSPSSLSFLEEKKLEEDSVSRSISWGNTASSTLAPSMADSRHLIVDDDVEDAAIPSNSNDDNIYDDMSASMQIMLKTLSPITPTPLNGWMGSTLQCSQCHHIRPIPNTPFLDIPLVPTALSNFMNGRVSSTNPTKSPLSRTPPCTVQECIQEFTSVEQVSGVECMSCTLQQEIKYWDEEVVMLEGALTTLMKKNNCSDQQEGLQLELARAKTRLQALQQLHPDDAESVLCEKEEWQTEEVDEVGGEDVDKATKIVRTDAWKRMVLTRLPTVLCLHVQRRFYDPHTDTMAKTAQHVEFTEILDANHFYSNNEDVNKDNNRGEGVDFSSHMHHQHQQQSPSPLYKLQSVIEHCGNAHAGHYQTYRKGGNDQWYLISDQTVRPLSWQRVKQCQAYMLFYEAM